MSKGHIVRNATIWFDDFELWKYRNKIPTLAVGAAVLLWSRAYDNYGRLPIDHDQLADWADLTRAEWDSIAAKLLKSWDRETDEAGTEWIVVRRIREQIDLQREKSEASRRAVAVRENTRSSQLDRTIIGRSSDDHPSVPFRTEPFRTEAAAVPTRVPDAAASLNGGSRDLSEGDRDALNQAARAVRVRFPGQEAEINATLKRWGEEHQRPEAIRHVLAKLERAASKHTVDNPIGYLETVMRTEGPNFHAKANERKR